jgi:tetratricopeptide (TPR) repeat protein
MTPLAALDSALDRLDVAAARAAADKLPSAPERELGALRCALLDGSVHALELMRRAEAVAAQLPAAARAEALGCAFEASLRARCHARASALLAELEPCAAAALTTALRGKLALARDARDEARSLLERAYAQDPREPRARLHLSELDYVEGKFPELLRRLGALLEEPGGGPRAAEGLRLIAHTHGARGEHGDEARVLAHLLARFPAAPSEPHDRLALAFAHASGGDYDAAARELHTLWARDPKGGLGRYARRRLDHLEASGAVEARRLAQFPTTHQKHNFCGPAVLELCLRYLGIALGQDEIAGVVKRETGTPMYEIGAFLRARGILGRRIEATPARIRSAIELGLPVIVQEEYSTTSHVAVITGYDPRLGVFIAQDPMTHRPELKSFEWTEQAGALFGSGGVVVVGRSELVTPERLAELDAAGLVDQKHLIALDAVDARRASLRGSEEDASADEVLAACDAALREAPGYPLAWARKGGALFMRQLHKPSDAHRGALLDFLQRARSAFRGAEWAHRLHAHVLENEGRLREAFAELISAHRADPSDAENLENMADCVRRLGELGDAEARFHDALACDPSYLRAAENLAALYVAALLHRSDAPFSDADALAWASVPDPGPRSEDVAHDDDSLTARADWYTALCLTERPQNPWNHRQRGLLEGVRGELAAARRAFSKAAELAPSPYVLGLVARAAVLGDEPDEASAAVEQLQRAFGEEPASWLWTAALAREAGEPEAAYAALVRGVAEVGAQRVALVDALWEAGVAFGGGEAAAVRLRQVVADAPHDPAFVREVARKVDGEHQRGVAIELLRAALALAPGDVNLRYRLGSLLSEDPTTEGEAQELLGEVLRQAPDATVARTLLAWTYLEQAPARGFDVLAPALDEGDAYVLETAGALALAAGDAARGSALCTKALRTFSTETEGRLALSRWHVYKNRYDLAVERIFPLMHALAALAPDSPELDGVARSDLEDALLTAARMAGRQMELHAWVKARCAEGVPEHLAGEVYWAYRDADPQLAAEGAEAFAAALDDADDQREYRIYAAGCRAQAGDQGPLDALAAGLDDDGVAWAAMYHAYVDAERYDDAARAAERAHRLAPHDLQSLSAWEMHCLDVGDKDSALAAAETALATHPYQHLGDERLALLRGRDLDAAEALAHSERALGLAPFCHLAQAARALALFVSGDHTGAARHAERSVRLEPSSSPDAWSDAEAIARALRGDAAGLERLFADRARRRLGWPFTAYDALLRSTVAARAEGAARA